ncbi:MAG: tyrosine-type recombinase/integrase [Proteobacteria bacterium]|nr:tyrosine-type recombinase/integrase [Pseudomonadota bacterium]
MKLTKGIVEGAILPEKGQRFLWDSETRGFGIRLTPSGRMYIVQGRVNGATRRVSLGRLGLLTLQQARKKAKRELSAMLEGIDPAMEKKRIEAYGLTLKEITEEYLRDRRDMKSSSRSDILKHLNRAFSQWADRPAIEITRDKVIALFRELTERGPAQANQAFRNLRAILNYARAAYRLDDDKPLLIENPVSVLSDTKMWNKIRARSGRIPTDKIGIGWNILQSLRESPGETIISHTLADALLFLLLTGARWSEMAALTWDRINLDEGWWFIPDPKNRNPVTFPLSRVAVDILTERPRSQYVFVFPARSGGGHIQEARGHFKKISDAVGIQISGHDLRRTFRAIAGEVQLELWKTKLLMNHRLNQDVTIGHYTETEDLRYLRPEIDKISDWIVRQGFIAKSDKVVPFPRKAMKKGGKL